LVIEKRIVVGEPGAAQQLDHRRRARLVDDRDVYPLRNVAVAPEFRHRCLRVALVQRGAPDPEDQWFRQFLRDHRLGEGPRRFGRPGQPRGEEFPIHSATIPIPPVTDAASERRR
jgi:hypothetical protein